MRLERTIQERRTVQKDGEESSQHAAPRPEPRPAFDMRMRVFAGPWQLFRMHTSKHSGILQISLSIKSVARTTQLSPSWLERKG